MISTLKAFLQIRLLIYEEDEELAFAAILDPKLKLSWCISDFLMEQYISNIRIKIKTIDQKVKEVSSPPHSQLAAYSVFCHKLQVERDMHQTQ